MSDKTIAKVALIFGATMLGGAIGNIWGHDVIGCIMGFAIGTYVEVFK